MSRSFDAPLTERSIRLSEPESDSFGTAIVLLHLMAAGIVVVTGLFLKSRLLPIYGLPLGTTIFIIGVYYSRYPSRKWYEEDLVPYIVREKMFTQGETDRLLSLTRTNKILFIIFSWLFAVAFNSLWVFFFDVPWPHEISLQLAWMMLEAMFFCALIIEMPAVVVTSIIAMEIVKKLYSDIGEVIDMATGKILRGIG